MTTDENITVNAIHKLLVALSRYIGQPCNVSKLVEETKSPYRGNIVGAMANLNIIKWTAKGIYTVQDFDASIVLARAVRTACLGATSKGKKLIPLAEYKSEPKPEPQVIREIVHEQVNPFGFMMFDTMMIEKGTIIIGNYKLEGSFTLTKLS